MPPDAIALRTFLARVARRVSWIAAAEGAAVGLVVALVVAIILHPVSDFGRSLAIAGALAALGAILRTLIIRRGPGLPERIERRAPQCRNLLLTASELQSGAIAADPVAPLVYAHAARLVSGLDPAELFPARNAIVGLLVAGALWSFAATRTAAGHSVLPAPSSIPAVASVKAIDARIVPPAYSNRNAKAVHDPARIEALSGSHIKLSVRAHAARLVIETLKSRDTILPSAQGETFTVDIPADADGYIAIEPSLAEGAPGARRLIGLTVAPDEPPRTRITLPGKDVLFSDAHHTLDIAIDAHDDIGLASLKLRYTKVAGSGERFTFVEGEVPLQITRLNDTAWTARAKWPLEGLGLDAGDMVVYRSVVTDRRPGSAPSESDSFIAEILAPGGNAAAGFSIDPEQERYAVSQQMVILKTERLLARKASMTADAYSTESQDIGGEQRKVRAEFVFMLGGELADAPDPAADPTMLNEEAEAEGEDDLLAGRSANQGHIAMLRAIRAMSRASSALTTADLETALTHEREALKQLESAFSRSRILLRALSERERLDLSRRLTGTITDATRDRRPVPEPTIDTRTASLRKALASVAEIAGSQTLGAAVAPRLSIIAENVLRVDPSNTALHGVATMLDLAATATRAGRDPQARVELDRAATAIAAVIGQSVLPAPLAAPTLDRGLMNGALRDALNSVPDRR